MSGIKPFRALHYNEEKAGELTRLVAPPYDIISAEQQTMLHNSSPYNFTHIDFAKDEAGDNETNNKYTRARTKFYDWINQNILIADDKPSIYFYKQEYTVIGKKYNRLGFIALMDLKSDEDAKVHPHENTHKHAVDDRYNLTEALNANLSCIFVCYSDIQRKVEKIFNKNVIKVPPMADVEFTDGVRHKLWRVDDADLIAEINQSVEGQNLFIADGHHRFKVATEYRKACLKKTEHPTGKEPFNYVMTYFTNLDSQDLQIFPMHRIIKKLPRDLSFLEDYFRMDKMKKISELMLLLAKAGIHEHAFGLYTKDGIQLLRLKNKNLIPTHVKDGSDDYKRLDASILKAFIFDKMGVDSKDIVYTKDIDDVTRMVDNAEADAGFIMNPVKISQLKAIALNAERMPPKTTYFYPKVLSGLTVYSMNE